MELVGHLNRRPVAAVLAVLLPVGEEPDDLLRAGTSRSLSAGAVAIEHHIGMTKRLDNVGEPAVREIMDGLVDLIVAGCEARVGARLRREAHHAGARVGQVELVDESDGDGLHRAHVSAH